MYSIELVVGFPPATTPLVEFDAAPGCSYLPVARSPKNVALPSEAIVIY